MSFTRAGDIIYTLRIIKLLTTPWNKQAAYKHGIIDDKGNLLRKTRDLKTSAEKDSFTYLHRMVFNMKRLLQKAPGGASFIAAATAAMLLLKESMGENLSDEQMAMIEEAIYNLEVSEEGVQGAPTNVTGSAVSTDEVQKPLTAVKRRNPNDEPSKKE
jgi:hypothetical protein